jgi:hypothetical protein
MKPSDWPMTTTHSLDTDAAEHSPQALLERSLPAHGRVSLAVLAGIGERLASSVSQLQRDGTDVQGRLARLEAWGLQLQELAQVVGRAPQLRQERVDLGLALLQTLADSRSASASPTCCMKARTRAVWRRSGWVSIHTGTLSSGITSDTATSSGWRLHEGGQDADADAGAQHRRHRVEDVDPHPHVGLRQVLRIQRSYTRCLASRSKATQGASRSSCCRVARSAAGRVRRAGVHTAVGVAQLAAHQVLGHVADRRSATSASRRDQPADSSAGAATGRPGRRSPPPPPRCPGRRARSRPAAAAAGAPSPRRRWSRAAGR